MAIAIAPLQAHLALIKKRLLIIGATIMVCFGGAFFYAREMIEWMARSLAQVEVDRLAFYGPTEALFAAIKVSLLVSIVVSLPMILYQFWKFIEPALLVREQRLIIPIFLLAGVLFALGLIFCNLVVLPMVLEFFVGFGAEHELRPELAVGTFVDFNVKFSLILGFGFELPLVLTLLARAGYVTVEDLKRFRKHAIMIILIVSAILTPDPTIYTMLLMAIPLIVMYEFGIVGARLFGRPRRRHAGPGGGGDADTAGQGGQPVPTGTAGYRIK